jgi:hypothetical protein
MLENPRMQRYSTCKANFAILSVTIRLLRTISRKRISSLTHMTRTRANDYFKGLVEGEDDEIESKWVMEDLMKHRESLSSDERELFDLELELALEKSTKPIRNRARQDLELLFGE